MALAGYAFFLAALALTANAQADDVDPPKDHAEKLSQGLQIFRKDVRGILVQHCLKCHGGETVESEFDLSDRAGLLKGGASGNAVRLWKSGESRLYERITHAVKPGMPFKQDKLPDAAIAHIAAWIDRGAPYDEPLVHGRAVQTSWTEKVLPADARQFWAFQPLSRAKPPVVPDDGWCRTPIDRFIFAKLNSAGLNPNPIAEKSRLIRRAYFDLVGLPPKPEAVEAFCNDQSPDAWESVIDRLLDSPQYGERWARHWLDVARFAESHGYENDNDRPTAFHYRDFVIEAFNRDLPYDTFVRWQVAGDEFTRDNNLALQATGFLAAGVHSTQITKREVEKHRYDELDDMLGTIGVSMLGLTIACARCHDHKFDPIPQRDYYRLLSTFTTTVRSEVDLDIDPRGNRRRQAEFDAVHAPLVSALRKFESEQLPARFVAWSATASEQLSQYPWTIVEPSAANALAAGLKLMKQPDGSFLAVGPTPKIDIYTFEVLTDETGISGIRIDALAHPALPKRGPGRSGEGNFELADLKVTIAPRSKPEGSQDPPDPTRLKLKNARATFEQDGHPVAAAIDDDDKLGWSIGPQTGTDQSAAFDFETPAGLEGGSKIVLTLTFRGKVQHAIGRIRISLTTESQPVELTAPGVPRSILTAMRLPADKRTAEQQAAALKWFAAHDADWQRLNAAVEEHLAQTPKLRLAKALISTEGLTPLRLNTQGGDFLEATHFLKRGDPNQKETIASQGFLQVLMPAPESALRWQIPPPEGWRTSYRRRALAQWLTDVDQGAGALLARVIVNRLWQHHLGRGIVATPNDFGVRGAAPSHPELLDYLAFELIRRGWSLKQLHRQIMTSAVYMQSAAYDETRASADRANHFYWRKEPRRLEAEVVRDSLLAAGALLDGTMFGPGTLDETHRRRSIYFTVKRSKLVPMMQAFDAPDALSSIGERSTTTVAPQALMLMNNPLARDCARGLAARVAPTGTTANDLANSLEQAYRLALARRPSAQELADGMSFIEAQRAAYRQTEKADAGALALADFCQVLLCLNEFVYVE